jgi:uncharacterized membrane-anchored protein YjiN (DUF445 family)
MADASSSSMSSATRTSGDDRLAQFKRMRLIAGGLLLSMLVLFAAASALQARWPWLAFFRAFAEAAMVGACADWFAVVSIFRHPFGIPLPHTAVVPRQKALIGESFGAFVADNFFAPAEVSAKLERLDAAGWVARWIAEPANARLAAERLQALVPVLVDLLNDGHLRSFSGGMIRRGIDSIAAAPFAAKLLAVLVAHGHHETAFDVALDRMQQFIEHHQERVRENVARMSARWVPTWVDDRVTNAFIAEFQKTLSAARDDAAHPWRVEYRDTLERLIARLANDEDLLKDGERLKSDVLDDEAVRGYIEWLGQEIDLKARAGLSAYDAVLVDYIERALVAFGLWLADNAEVRAIGNRWVQQLVFNAVVPNRGEIGAFISEVIARWNTKTLIDKLELQVGRDLQFIRINGTLIGGLVGLGIFVVTRWIA